MNNAIIKKGILSGLIAVAYIAAVALFMAFADRIFGLSGGGQIFSIMLVLILLVFSAAFMFVVLLGGPVMMYSDGKKKEALRLLAWSLGSLLTLGVLIGFLVAVLR